MTPDDLRKISMVQLDIMDEIHSICEAEDITYYIIAGTLLGAVRHGGFIPWDIDIDIAMTRDNYERFKASCEKNLKEPYVYRDYQNCSNFPRPHALVSRMDTKVSLRHDHLNPKTENLGIYVDVFPLDNAPDDEKMRERQAKDLRNIEKIKKIRLPYSYSYKKWKRYAHYAVSAVLSIVSLQRINRYQQNLMMKYNSLDTEKICSMASQYAYSKQCMDREIYGKPVLLEFEGRQYYAPAKYKDYLTNLYGDYMQLPPIEKRNKNLDFYTSVELPEEFGRIG